MQGMEAKVTACNLPGLSFVLGLAVLVMGGVGAQAEETPPPQRPLLRIEAGMHTALIRRVGVDRTCRIMATGSEDKTIRIWELPTTRGGRARLLRKLRPPIGPGNTGKIYAVAMSPDGRWVVAGGWDPYDAVYVFDTNTGRIHKRLKGLGNVINQLTFSHDGRFLAAILGGGKGLRIWETRRWHLVKVDTGFSTQGYGADFGPDGRLYATAYDGYLRRYSPSLKLEIKKLIKKNRRLFGVAVNPKGDRVAVGIDDEQAVEVYDTKTLKLLFKTDMRGVKNGDLASVTWSADGERLYAGGQYGKHGLSMVRMWARRGEARGRDLDGPLSTIMHLLPCRDMIAVGGADPAFGLLDAKGDKFFWESSVKPDMRNKLRQNFTVSPDGLQVRFGLSYGSKNPVLFDLSIEQLIEDAEPLPSLHQADIKSLKITDWEDRRHPKLNGKAIKLKLHETSRSIAITPDKQHFILGGDWSLRAYNKTGKKLWEKQVPGVVWGINTPHEAPILIAAHDDGTIRWYRLSDGKELLALFVQARDKRWVAWTPKGYYTTSPGGEALIGWHLNGKTWDIAADFFPVGQFRKRFYRPDIIRLVLETLDEDHAVELANRTSKRRRQEENIRQNLPPVIKILSPVYGATFTKKQITVEYDLRSPSGQKVTKIDVLVDGRPLGSKGWVPESDKVSGRITVPLPSRDVSIALVARTRFAASEAFAVQLKWGGSKRSIETPNFLKPKLYALIVGVSKYQREELRLDYAAKDARDFAAAIRAQEGGLYSKIHIKLLTDDKATEDNILDGLTWLEEEVSNRDVGVLFLSGHGVTDRKQRFYYMPVDGNPKRLKATGIKQSDIQDTLRGLPGKILMFIDTCHSAASLVSGVKTRGSANMTAVLNEMASAENGVVMFSSSTGRELSVESSRWENGAFTEALIEGLSDGKADISGDGIISVKELDYWISERVKQLTDKQQHPVSRLPDIMPDFPIALAGAARRK